MNININMKKFLNVLLVTTMIASCTACHPQSENSSQTNQNSSQSDNSFVSSGTAESEDSGITSSATDSLISSGDEKSATSSGNKSVTGSKSGSSGVSSILSSGSSLPNATKIFKVEDYGARGDGKTDDGPAIAKAVQAACRDDSAQKVVQFKSNTTYRVISVPANNSTYMCVMQIVNAENVTVQGNNTKLLMKAPCRVLRVTESSNIKVKGFVVDYSPKPFALGKVTAVNTSDSYIDFSCSDDLGFTGEKAAPSTYFAFRNRKDERLHFMINKMKKLGTNSYRFYFSNANRVSQASVGEDFILPVYGSSHVIGGLFNLYKIDNFSLENVTIYAMPDFGFDIRRNTGYTNFINVKIAPEPGSPIYLASWRDGFHVKDNLSKLTWDHCYIGPLGDDAYNLSTVICNVDSFNDSNNTVTMVPAEDGTTREGLAVGDELVAYNMNTGAAIGEAKIAAILPASGSISIRLDRHLNLTRNCQIAFYRFNKNFVVKNTYIEGTVRVRTSGTFENCQFNVFWVHIENEYFVEGPIPKDITFRGCTFTTPYAANTSIFHVGTMTAGQSAASYKCKNIVLDGCSFTKGTYDVQSGNQLIIK